MIGDDGRLQDITDRSIMSMKSSFPFVVFRYVD